MTNHAIRGWCRVALPAVVAIAIAHTAKGEAPAAGSPDGLWLTLPAVQFPARYSPPTSFAALSLDALRLAELLKDAPREVPGRIVSDTRIFVPLPDGTFAPASVAETRLMEAGLAARFPQVRSYVLSGEGFSGHVVLGPRGLFLRGQTGDGLWQVDPVETAAGRVYVSYLDRNRTDGANVIIHDPDMHEGDEPPVPRIAARSLRAPALLQPLGLQAGSQLRTYRLAASTTGEFYQARDAGGGQADVVASIVADLAGANAVFEPEVSVRLVLADASLNVLYDDATTDPFDNSATPCSLRDANRDNMKAVLNDADYDLGFLFATRAGGGANGCAWFVACLTTNDTLHKARGAGQMGNNGLNSASGLLAHETGHQLGARHTFTGQAGGCTLVEFQAGDSESGYEPGSGTTRMSYAGNCDSDNVDTSAVGTGSYFHSRSFDEIVDNVFSGDGATCGSLANTTNSPPVVDAGTDYTIPRQTPFTLSGSATDDEPLTYNWEQFDRALTQRAINTDPGDGPIVRSVPPGSDTTRTIPRMPDLLAGVTRAGEILPQVDRELNFRLIARDNLMGGGGVAYDEMKVTVQGDRFFITSPNSGSLEAACQAPLTWQVGGGSVAPQVQAFFSSDGGQSFGTPLTGAIPNDGADSFTVPCQLGSAGRIKLQSVGNIFFDVNDEDLNVSNTPPAVQAATAGGAVDDACEFTVNFSGTASDVCGMVPGNVAVELTKGADNFTLGTPTVNLAQVDATTVGVQGSVLVSDLLGGPAQLFVKIKATDACGAPGSQTVQAVAVDETPPTISVALSPTTLWPPQHKLAPIQATVVAADNCPGAAFVLTSVVSNEPENGTGDGDTAPDVVDTVTGTPDTEFQLRSERAGGGDGRVYTATYTASDGSGNTAHAGAAVRVPKSNRP